MNRPVDGSSYEEYWTCVMFRPMLYVWRSIEQIRVIEKVAEKEDADVRRQGTSCNHHGIQMHFSGYNVCCI